MHTPLRIDAPAHEYPQSAHFLSNLRVVLIRNRGDGHAVFFDALKSMADQFTLVQYGNPQDALEYMQWHAVDLVFIDCELAPTNGIEAIRLIRQKHPIDEVPIIMTSNAMNHEMSWQAFVAGANDCVQGSPDFLYCKGRCLSLLHGRRRFLHSQSQLNFQEDCIENLGEEVRMREKETLLHLARAADQRDASTGSHLKRMAKYASLIAIAHGMSGAQAATLEMAAPMHDIGKIGIPDAILRRKGSLSAVQSQIMKNHTRIGYEILRDSTSRFLQLAASIALNHHEKFDGSGYPNGLCGADIPIEARIVAVADVFDALTSRRSYKAAWNWDRAVAHLIAQKNRHFDPALVDLFVARLPEARAIHDSLSDPHIH